MHSLIRLGLFLFRLGSFTPDLHLTAIFSLRAGGIEAPGSMVDGILLEYTTTVVAGEAKVTV